MPSDNIVLIINDLDQLSDLSVEDCDSEHEHIFASLML